MSLINYKKITALASTLLFSLPSFSVHSQELDPDYVSPPRSPRQIPQEPSYGIDDEIPAYRPKVQSQCIGRWFYQTPKGNIDGPYYGCTKEYSNNGKPWCATKVAPVQSEGRYTENTSSSKLMTVTFPTYISGGSQGTTFRECSEEEYLQDYLLGPLPKLNKPLPPSQGCPPLDIMLLIDNTKSMQEEIAQAKKIGHDVIEIIQKLYPGSRFSVATVADAPQNYRSDDQPYQHLSNFTPNIDVTMHAINDIDLMHGGDIPEAYPHALRYASNEAWNPLATRLVILIADSYARKNDLLRLSIDESNFKLITLVADEKYLDYWSQFSSETLPLSDVDNLEGLLLRSVMSGCHDYPQIYFPTNHSNLNKKDQQKLDHFAQMLLARNEQYDLGIFVDGHADERGSGDFNNKLGLKRAQSVCSYLEKKGLICLPESYGEDQPFCQSSTSACYQQNRRGHLYPVDLNSPRIQKMIDPQILKDQILPHLRKRNSRRVNNLG